MNTASKSQVELLLDDVEAVRQSTIATKTDTPELRSLLRTIVPVSSTNLRAPAT